MKVSMIVAASERGIIGRGGQLPWRIPSDLRRFKSLTMGHAYIVGRRTWDEVGRPLPGRRMIVVTRSTDRTWPEGVVVVPSLVGDVGHVGWPEDVRAAGEEQDRAIPDQGQPPPEP